MAVDLPKLALQGRAYSASRAWEPAELEILLLIERERKVPRTAAADYVRNGITSLEEYDKAVEADFKPQTLEESAKEAEVALKGRADVVKKAKKGEKK